ncbi:MAG: hypothetical protein LC660_03655 [Desulfobacteraceae bacterium]|nr:hypothetical protein [Desulfobacteraceae bacterium]
MKTVFLTLLFFFVIGMGIGGAEPFARKIDVPEEMLKPTHPAALDAMMTQNSKVPSKEKVGISPYQGAKILFTQQPSNLKMNGKKIEANHMIAMGTIDKTDQVLSFFRTQVADWTYKEVWGTHIFYKGRGEFKLMDESSMVTPHIQIREALPQENPLMPDMKTVIEIYYRP